MVAKQAELIRPTQGWEEIVLGDDNIYTTMTRVWLDAAPPIPPRPVQAEYAGSGEHVAIQFDRPLNIEIGRRYNCSDFFELDPAGVPNAAVLPTAECEATFVSAVEMRIKVAAKVLHRNPKRSLQPGKMLVFKDRALRNLDSLNHAYVSGQVEVGWPSDAVKPRVVVDVPSIVGPADQWVRFDLSRSTGSAGRPWVDAHFYFQSTAVELAPMEAPLQAALNEVAARLIKTGRLAFDLPSNLLHEYINYQFRFTLWNVFGDYDTTTVTVGRVGAHLDTNQLVPSISIEGPSTVLRSEPVRLLAVLPERLADGREYNATLTWSMLASPRPMKLRGATKPALIFDRFALAAGTYIVSLKVNLQPKEGAPIVLAVLAQHSFKVASGPWGVEIVGGSRLVGALDTVSLQARPVDLAPLAGQQSLSQHDFEWSWSCATGIDRAGPCLTRDGFLVELPAGKAAIQLPISAIPGGSQLSIQVVAKSKATGQVHSDSIIVEVDESPAEVIPVSIEASPSRPSPAPGEELILTARLEASSAAKPIFKSDGIIMADLSTDEPKSPVTFKWESMQYCGGKYYAHLPFLDATSQTAEGEDRQTIPASLLIPGAEYCFRVSVGSPEGKRGWAYTIVQSKSSPSSGYCELESPATGRAFESVFTIACHGWTADTSTSGALKYRFFKRTKKDLLPLAPGSHKSRLSVPLDVGHALLEAHISDDHGVTTVVPVRQVSARLSNTTREDFMLDKLRAFDSTGNIQLGFQVSINGPSISLYDFIGFGVGE